MCACTDPHTGGAWLQGLTGPLPMRRYRQPSRSGPHAQLVLVCVVRALLPGSLHAQRTRSRRRMPHIGGMCNQGGFASKASPPSVLTQVLPSLTGSAKQRQAEEAPRKTLALRILALKLWF